MDQMSKLTWLRAVVCMLIDFSSFLLSSTLSLLPLTSKPFISSMASAADLGFSKLTKPIPLDFPFFSVMTLVDRILPNFLKSIYNYESFMLLGKWNKNKFDPGGPSFLVELCISLRVLIYCWI